MPQLSAQVTAAEISRLAGVTRATVSNWRRRHADFPAPVGGTSSSPSYDLDAVRAWLTARNQLPTASPRDDLRTSLRRLPPSVGTAGLVRLVVAAHVARDLRPTALLDLPDDQLLREVEDLVRQPGEGLKRFLRNLPPSLSTKDRPADPALIRALLRCMRDDGAETALDVLAEHGPQGSGTYPTPAWLADLMAALLKRPDGDYPATVMDPACGVGTLLAAAAERGAEHLFGQDLLPSQALQTAARLRVSAPNADGEALAGDSIRHDGYPGLRAEGILCNPPFGDRDWGQDDVAVDPRWTHGLPPKMESELAWTQHCLAHLAPGGTAIVLLPPGVAERASGRRIRAELIRSGALKAVIALPAGAAIPLHVGLHLWILHRRGDGAGTPPDVLFVDAAALAVTPANPPTIGTAAPGGGTAGSANLVPGVQERPAWVADDETRSAAGADWPSLVKAVEEIWQAFLREPETFEPRPGAARAVPVIELLDDSVDLSPYRHVRGDSLLTAPGQHAEAVNSALQGLSGAAQELIRLAEVGPRYEQRRQGYEQEPAWRTATVDDLLRGGALTLLRGTGAQPPPATSATAAEATAPDSRVRSRQGDILLPELVQQGPLRAGGVLAHVVTPDEADQPVRTGWYVLRPVPERFDTWFLAGFLSAAPNLQAATTGTTVVRLDIKRLRIPLLPLEEQRRYGDAFRHVDGLRRAAQKAARLADETAEVLGTGLAAGALLPPESTNPPPDLTRREQHPQ